MSDFGVHRFWAMNPKNGVFEKREKTRFSRFFRNVIFEHFFSTSQRELVDTIFDPFFEVSK